MLQDYRAIAADWSQTGVEMVKIGDADAAIKGAAKVIAADYFSDHVSHMCMEPMNVTVRVDNGTIDIWSGNQSPCDDENPRHDHRQDHAGQSPHPYRSSSAAASAGARTATIW